MMYLTTLLKGRKTRERWIDGKRWKDVEGEVREAERHDGIQR